MRNYYRKEHKDTWRLNSETILQEGAEVTETEGVADQEFSRGYKDIRVSGQR
jgi:hypothetical protein